MFEFFPVSRYRLYFLVRTPIFLHIYPGSTLRGVFGAALKRKVCKFPRQECALCPHYQACEFPLIFKMPRPEGWKEDPPQPYVVEPPINETREPMAFHCGDVLSFNFVLIGRAQNHLPLCIAAWKDALLELGIDNVSGARGRGIAELFRVTLLGNEGEVEVANLDRGTFACPHNVFIPSSNGTLDSLTIEIVTPLRFTPRRNPKAQGDSKVWLSPEELKPLHFFRRLISRIHSLSQLYTSCQPGFPNPELSINFGSEKSLAEWNWQRFSGTQNQKIPSDGVIGTWRFYGDIQPFLPYIELGELLHIGKGTAYGMGKYTVK